MINKTTFLIICLAASTGLSAQVYKDSIRNQFKRYTDLLVNKQFEKSTDYLNVNLFKFVPKAQLVTVMEKVYNNPDMEFITENPSITNMGTTRLLINRIMSN